MRLSSCTMDLREYPLLSFLPLEAALDKPGLIMNTSLKSSK